MAIYCMAMGWENTGESHQHIKESAGFEVKSYKFSSKGLAKEMRIVLEFLREHHPDELLRSNSV